MTVTYTNEVTTSKGISVFLKLLARWRGSIYKLVWADLLMFLVFYYALSLSYRFLFNADAKINFENVVMYCDKYSSLIPLSFVLGFYVSLVMTRWWSQYSSIPFPDNLAIIIGASIKGQDDRAKIVRRTIMRYVCVAFTITLTMLSPKVKKRFPTLGHFVDSGLITRDEQKIMEELDAEFPSYSKYWLPLAWASNVITRARHEGLIRDDVSVKTILEEVNGFRSRLGTMLDYDWISIPLVYTQVVTLAVYFYFVVTAIGRQYVETHDGQVKVDLYFPFLPVLEFFFYMGWLKVAEVLINPYGDDDDDFEVVWMIDRHLQVSYLIVDKIHQEHPKLVKDLHWAEGAPNSLPFTVASQDYMQEYPSSSTANVTVKKSDQDLIIVGETITQPDGLRRRSGPALWKLLQKQGGVKNFPLKRVVSTTSRNGNIQGIEEMNEYADDITINNKPSTNSTSPEGATPLSSNADFTKLKLQRREIHKRRMLKLLELQKAENSEHLWDILDDIVS